MTTLVTTMTTARLGFEHTERSARALASARRLAEDELAGRCVWCAAALPRARASAVRLQGVLADVVDSPARRLDVTLDEGVRRLAGRLDAELADGRARRPLSPDEAELLAAAASAAERLVRRHVRRGDVVVVHDVAWRVRPGPAPAALLGVLTHGMDAFVADRPGRLVALMPAGAAVAAKETPVGAHLDGAGWVALLAAVVQGDRVEHVGGTLHARPGVAAR
jgi:hypothetical protein